MSRRTYSDMPPEIWLALLPHIRPYVEKPDGHRFLGWYGSLPQYRNSTSLYRFRDDMTTQLLGSLKSAEGRDNVARVVLSRIEPYRLPGRSAPSISNIWSVPAVEEIVNAGGVSIELRVRLFEYARVTSSRTAMSQSGVRIRSIRCFNELYPHLTENALLRLIPRPTVTGPRRSTGSAPWLENLSQEDRVSFARRIARDERPEILEAVIPYMQVHHTREVSEPFAKGWLANPVPRVRVATLKLLESYGTREVVPLVVPLLKDKASSVRAEAARVLGSLVAVEARKDLESVLLDPASEVRTQVRKALLTIANAGLLEVPEAGKRK